LGFGLGLALAFGLDWLVLIDEAGVEVLGIEIMDSTSSFAPSVIGASSFGFIALPLST
jgi:hypothetical protein